MLLVDLMKHPIEGRPLTFEEANMHSHCFGKEFLFGPHNAFIQKC